MAPDSHLIARLDALRGDDASLTNGFSNHLPMALAALHALGASVDRLDAFAAAYRSQLRPLPPSQTPHDFPAQWARFQAMLSAEHRDAVLRRELPVLFEGLATAAFHGLIRLAYGVRFESISETAAGLALLAAHRRETPRPSAPGSIGAAEGLRCLAQGPALEGVSFERPLIMGRLIEVMARPAFLGAVPSLRIEKGADRAWHSLAVTAGRLYRATGDFTALHLITSLHALQVLWPWIEDREAVLQRYWFAFCAAYVAIGRPWPMALQPLPDPLPRWPALRSAATASSDDHVIKLVDSCHVMAHSFDPDTSELPVLLQACAAQIVDADTH
ncbi:questin oxidase family protein [Niveibacterium umoris]